MKKQIKLVRVWPHIEIDNKLVQEANRVIWQKLFSLNIFGLTLITHYYR
jgi:hypothetical protein